MDLGEGLLLGGTGLVAGAVNTVAGGGSLLTFPALLALGLPTLQANVTNTVGLVPGQLGGILGFRRELRGQGRRLARLVPVVLAGSLTGVVLLLELPGAVFDAIVPPLLVAACVLLAFQPRITAALRKRARDTPTKRTVPVGLQLAMVPTSIYGGYFGAAMGVVLVAVLGIGLAEDLPTVNAVKVVLTTGINLLASVVFVLQGPVHAGPAAVLAVTSAVGGYAGAGVTRKVPLPVLRSLVVTTGLVVASYLFIR